MTDDGGQAVMATHDDEQAHDSGQTTPLSDARLAEIREWLTWAPDVAQTAESYMQAKANSFLAEAFAEVERLRAREAALLAVVGQVAQPPHGVELVPVYVTPAIYRQARVLLATQDVQAGGAQVAQGEAGAVNEDIWVGRFHKILPDHLRAGDIIMCYAHDDQWEQRNALVCEVAVDRTSGVWDIPWSDGSKVEHWAYDYRVTITARHVSLKRPEATGGPVFTWRFYPWNSVYRFEQSVPKRSEA